VSVGNLVKGGHSQALIMDKCVFMHRMVQFIALGVLLLSLVFLTNCSSSSGGGDSGDAEETEETEESTSFSELVFVEVDDADSDIVSVATDGSDSLTVLGDKDADGIVTNITGFIYSGEDGTVLEFELGNDGRPSSVVDDDGNTATFTNYTSSTVDITFYDSDNILIYGPVTTEVDTDVLSQSLLVSSSLSISDGFTDKLLTTNNLFTHVETGCLDEGLKATIVASAAVASAYVATLTCGLAVALAPATLGATFFVAVGQHTFATPVQ